MKRFLSLVALVFAVPALSFGEELELNFESATTCKFFNEYLGANGGVFYDKPVVQCDVWLGLENGLYGDVWVSKPEGSWMSNFGSEVDVTLGKTGMFRGFRYDVAIAYYAIWNANAGLADVLNPYIEVGKPTAFEGLSWFLRVEHYMPVSGSSPLQGQMVHIGLKHSDVIGRGSLSLKGEIFYDSGAFGSDEAVIFGAQATFLWPTRLGVKIGPTMKYFAPMTSVSERDGRHGEIAWGLVITQ